MMALGPESRVIRIGELFHTGGWTTGGRGREGRWISCFRPSFPACKAKQKQANSFLPGGWLLGVELTTVESFCSSGKKKGESRE